MYLPFCTMCAWFQVRKENEYRICMEKKTTACIILLLIAKIIYVSLCISANWFHNTITCFDIFRVPWKNFLNTLFALSKQ